MLKYQIVQVQAAEQRVFMGPYIDIVQENLGGGE